MSETTHIEDAGLKEALANQCNEDWCANGRALIVSQLLAWRSQASYYQGKCEGLAEAVEYLKGRVERLEAITKE